MSLLSLFFEIYANTKCIYLESLSPRYDIERNTKSRIIETKSTRSKFAKGARVIVESAGRNLSVRRQVTDTGPGPRSPSRSRTNLEHTCPVRARETILSFGRRCPLIVIVVVVVSYFGFLDLQADLLSHI